MFSTSKIKILCYGDSNTWGLNPHKEFSRYPEDIRWTGRLKRTLGNDYLIDEEGLSGRTTNLDDSLLPGLNGEKILIPYLKKHHPTDLVILFLGTNDLKEHFHRSALDIAQAIQELVVIIQTEAKNSQGKPSHILLISPTIVDESVDSTQKEFHHAQAKSEQLGTLYAEVAKQKGCFFLDLSKYVHPSKVDGVHFDEVAHIQVAHLIGGKITTEIFPQKTIPKEGGFFGWLVSFVMNKFR